MLLARSIFWRHLTITIPAGRNGFSQQSSRTLILAQRIDGPCFEKRTSALFGFGPDGETLLLSRTVARLFSCPALGAQT